MESDRSNYGIDIDTLLESLPACKHCRATRRRCDTKLPSCENCTRSDRECTFYDHVLSEELPREYIASLVDHLNALGDGDPVLTDVPHAQETPENRQQNFAFSRGTHRYLGAESSLLKLRPRELGEAGHKMRSSKSPTKAMPSDGIITPAWHGYLLRVFFGSIHHVYPVLDPSLPWLSPDAVMELEDQPAQASMLQLVYAIAGHCDSKRPSTLLSLASPAHRRALGCIDKATAEQSTSTLQVATLLALYALFDPTSSNISQQLGFAIRLAIDLGGSDNDEDPGTLSTLHKIIYCLENDVCSILARPTSLPEPAIPITFSVERPIDFLCTLYRIQSRYRRRSLSDALRHEVMNLDHGELRALHPNILSTLWETCLMVKPSADIAVQLLSAYTIDGHIATFLTAHRVHEAASIIVNSLSAADEHLRYKFLLAYGNAAALLGRWSGIWEDAGILLKELEDRVRAESTRQQLPTATCRRS